MDLRKMNQVISGINKMIEMKLLKVDFSTRKFSLHKALWDGKDYTFKSNWCRNVALYWNESTSIKDNDGVFIIHDIETDQQIAEYNFGLKVLIA